MTDDLRRAAELLRQRNEVDRQLAALIGQPPTTGHLGRWIAAQIFAIDLAGSASQAGWDGIFRAPASLAGRTVNVKF